MGTCIMYVPDMYLLTGCLVEINEMLVVEKFGFECGRLTTRCILYQPHVPTVITIVHSSDSSMFYSSYRNKSNSLLMTISLSPPLE